MSVLTEAEIKMTKEQIYDCGYDRGYKNGKSDAADKIRSEIEHMIPCGKEALSIKLGVLEILDNY